MPHANFPKLPLARIEQSLPALYFAVALPLTLILCLLNAPFFGPDEQHHAARAIAIAHGHLLAHPGSTGEAGIEIDANALAVMDTYDRLRMDWEKLSPDFHNRSYGPLADVRPLPQSTLRWSNKTAFAPFPNTAVYPPVLYLPAIVGWRIAEAANLTILHSLHLARLLAAFTAVGLGCFALRLCDCSRWLLFAFLLLPSTLFLNATSSQDATLLSVAALAAALLTRPLAQSRLFTRPELAATALLLTLCATARPPYLALALLLFLPSIELPGLRLTRFIPPALAVTGVLTLAALWRSLVLSVGLDTPDEADPRLQTLFLHHHPIPAGLAILSGTLEAAVDLLHRGLYVIGWNDLLPPVALPVSLAIALALILIVAPRHPPRTWPGRILLGISLLAPLLGISLAEYIMWTPPGHSTVYGIQPRYWLPILPFLILFLHHAFRPEAACPKTRYRSTQTYSRLLLTTAATLLIAAALTLPWMAAWAFYRQPLVDALRLNLQP